MPIDDVKLSFDQGGLLVVNAILAVIMFGVALDLKVRDFTVILEKPKAPLVGLAAQLFLLPAFTYLLTLIVKPSPSVALGMILIAACPSGNMSNFLTHLSRGNTALSVTVTAVSTVAALVMTPFNLSFWGNMNPATGALITAVKLSAADVMFTVFLILGLPLCAGIAFARFAPRATNMLRKPIKYFSLVAFILFLIVAFAQNFNVFIEHSGPIFLVVILHNAVALATGYFSAKALRLPERDCRAVSIEVGIQNSALGLSLVFAFFHGLGGMAIVAGLWGIWHCISGLAIATFWSRRPHARPDVLALEAEET